MPYPRRSLREILDRGTGELRTKTDVEEVDPLESARQTCPACPTGSHYDALISTIPLPELIWRIPQAPTHIQRLAADLRCVSWRYLNVATRTPPPVDYQWVYVPEEHYPFFRVGVFNNAVPSMAPPGGGSLYVELTERAGALNIPEILQALADTGAITAASDVAFAELHEIQYAYVVFDDAYEEATTHHPPMVAVRGSAQLWALWGLDLQLYGRQYHSRNGGSQMGREHEISSAATPELSVVLPGLQRGEAYCGRVWTNYKSDCMKPDSAMRSLWPRTVAVDGTSRDRT